MKKVMIVGFREVSRISLLSEEVSASKNDCAARSWLFYKALSVV